MAACRDGGIDATIDHEQSFMSSKEVIDIYSTEEPQSAFHARVAFCLDIHNEVSPSCCLLLGDLALCRTAYASREIVRRMQHLPVAEG